MKQVLVFGATGGSGKEVVIQALKKGYAVTAVLRNPDAFPLEHAYLRKIAGNVRDKNSFIGEIQPETTVISCLGQGSSRKATTLFSEGISQIISAMQEQQASRLLCISAGALYIHPGMSFFTKTLIRFILEPLLKNVYADMRIMENTVRESSLQWTIVRPPRLTYKPRMEKYRTAVGEPLKNPSALSRADLAHALLTQMNQPETFRRITEVSN